MHKAERHIHFVDDEQSRARRVSSLTCLHIQCRKDIDDDTPCLNQRVSEPGSTLLARRSRPELGLPSLGGPLLVATPEDSEMGTPALEDTDSHGPSTGDITPSPLRSATRFEEPTAPLLSRGGKRPSFSRSRSAFDAVPPSFPPRDDFRIPVDPHVASLQMSLPRRSSDGDPRFSFDSYGHSRHATGSSFASTFGSISGPYTPDDELSRFNWTSPSRGGDLETTMKQLEIGSKGTPSQTRATAFDQFVEARAVGLMGSTHFGPAVKTKVTEVLNGLLPSVPLSGDEDEVITICEYGALNSRSASLMPDIIAPLAKRQAALVPSHNGPSRACFFVNHCDSLEADFRPISAELELSESYLSEAWQRRCDPPLTDRIFSSYSARPRSATVLPPQSVSVGISLFDLHWAQASSATERSGAIASRELDTFLRTRANEFRSGGLLVFAFIQRSEDPNSGNRPISIGSEMDAIASLAPPLSGQTSLLGPSPSFSAHRHNLERRRSGSSPSRPTFPLPPAKRDLWTALTRTLTPCIQRLVSCGMIKSDVARDLLTLPERFHPRTPRQTAAVLRSRSEEWSIEYAAGLSETEGATTPRTSMAPSLEGCRHDVDVDEPLMLVHPACKALQAGLMGPKVYAEHCIQLVKTLYEHHFRGVLSRRGKFSRSATEYIVEQLFDILREKVEEGDLQLLELEVAVVALRRR